MPISLEASRGPQVYTPRRSLKTAAPLLLVSLLVGCGLNGSGVDGESGFVGTTRNREPDSIATDAGTHPELNDTGSGSITPGLDAALPVNDPIAPFELAIGGETFLGSVALKCDRFERGPLALQFTLNSDGASIIGRSWGLPVYGIGAASGTTSADGTTVTLALPGSDGSDYYLPIELVLGNVSLDASGLHADVTAEITAVSGDIGFQCQVQGTYTFERDTKPPEFVGIPTHAVGFSPIEFAFSEPVRSDATIQILHAGVPLQTTSTIGTSDLILGASLTPLEAWPSGELTLRVAGAADVAGNAPSAAEWPIAVPTEYMSASLNPGFEGAVDGAAGPWYFELCSVSTESDAGLLPEEWAQYLICAANGRVLQAYIVPPAGATHLLIDVASTATMIPGVDDDFLRLAAGFVPQVSLTLMNGKESLPLQLIEPDSNVTPPQIYTFRGELPGDGTAVWLLVDNTGYKKYTDIPSVHGKLLVDNLRFE